MKKTFTTKFKGRKKRITLLFPLKITGFRKKVEKNFKIFGGISNNPYLCTAL